MTNTAPWFTAYGLLIRSFRDLPLPPSHAEPPDRALTPDIDLQLGTTAELSDAPLDREDPAIVASYEAPQGRWYVGVADEGVYRLTFRDCGEFVISSDLKSIRWIEQGSRAELMPVLFAGTVLAFYLTIRRELILHASAVASKGRALAFVGQSGRGKSTLAALTVAAGARVVTDDVLLINLNASPEPACRGSAGELRLREGASQIADRFAAVERRTTVDRRIGLLSADAESDWLPIGAIVIPSPSREATDIDVLRTPRGDAVIRLLAFPRVHGLRSPSLLRRQFEMLSDLVCRVPVYDVVIPWGPPFGANLADALLELAKPSTYGR